MNSRRVGIYSAGAVIVGALVLMVFRWSLASEAVYPVERLACRVIRAVRVRVAGAFAGASVAAENDRLRREAEALSMVRGDLERLRAENVRLRKVLGYRASRPEAWIAAEVMSRGGGAAAVHHAIRVDKGQLDGVKSGAVVVVPEGLVGRVMSVSPHTAEIALLTDASVKVSCEIEADAYGRIHGILTGGEPDRLRLQYLERAERVQPLARVVTSGLGGVFPRGLEIGTVHLVTNGVRGVEGEVLPDVEFSTLEDVFIRRDS